MLSQDSFNEFIEIFAVTPFSYEVYNNNIAIREYIDKNYNKYKDPEYTYIIRLKEGELYIPTLVDVDYDCYKYKHVLCYNLYTISNSIYLKGIKTTKYRKKFKTNEELVLFVSELKAPITPKILAQFQKC